MSPMDDSGIGDSFSEEVSLIGRFLVSANDNSPNPGMWKIVSDQIEMQWFMPLALNGLIVYQETNIFLKIGIEDLQHFVLID